MSKVALLPEADLPEQDMEHGEVMEQHQGEGPSGLPHTPVDPLKEDLKGVIAPQPSEGAGGTLDGCGDGATFQQSLIINSNYKGTGISPPISPSTETKTSAQTSKTSMAAMIREIARKFPRPFSVDEITMELMKSKFISPLPSTPGEWQRLNKGVSNTLGKMAKAGPLLRIKGKKGVYRWPVDGPELVPTPLLENDEGRDRLRILRVIPTPLPVLLPLGLERYVLIYPGDFIVVAGATNAGKTAFFLNLVWLNWNLLPVKYLTSELSDVRLSIRLHDFCKVHGTSLNDWDEHVDFRGRSSNFAPALNPAWLNVVDYLEVYREFHEVGVPLREMFRRQQGQTGVTFVGLQMKHGNVLGRGGSLSMEKAFLYLTMDCFKERGLNRLVIEKAKDPANDEVNPNGLDFWFRIEKGCKFVAVDKPRDADKLVAKARKQAGVSE
jgi:hypothetical protein